MLYFQQLFYLLFSQDLTYHYERMSQNGWLFLLPFSLLNISFYFFISVSLTLLSRTRDINKSSCYQAIVDVKLYLTLRFFLFFKEYIQRIRPIEHRLILYWSLLTF